MKIILEEKKFKLAHQAFLEKMYKKSGGIEFTDFHHPLITGEEIIYKWAVFNSARNMLELTKWKSWIKEPGKILKKVKEIFNSKISSNLVEHRYGSNNPDKPLYNAEKKSNVHDLELELDTFFNGGSSSYYDFGKRFDRFANYLKDNKLGCVWQFMAYLSFLVDPNKYFCILTGKFEKLLQYYGNDIKLTRNINWNSYLSLLKLADMLEEKLSYYGYIDRVGVHSYMWVVANLIMSGKVSKKKKPKIIDYDKELEKRINAAKRREKIGFLGEKIVLENEVKKLKKLRINKEVRLISATNEDTGYDILSYDEKGNAKFIEVKSTTMSEKEEMGFSLTNNEYIKAKNNKNWHLYRVYQVENNPTIKNFGNIVMNLPDGWSINPSNWFCKN